jgi:hypothetical protein
MDSSKYPNKVIFTGAVCALGVEIHQPKKTPPEDGVFV